MPDDSIADAASSSKAADNARIDQVVTQHASENANKGATSVLSGASDSSLLPKPETRMKALEFALPGQW